MKDLLKSKTLKFKIEHFDIGATIMTTISIGNQHVVSYYAHTRYTDTADEAAAEVLAAAFKDQIIASVTTNRHSIIENPNDPYGEEEYENSYYRFP